MIRTGFDSAELNESLSGELAKAVQHLTPPMRRQMVAGLGDVDIQNTDIPITKLSGPRDSRIKSKEYYFFFVYKSAFGKTPYQLMVTDELKQRVIIDTMLNSVVTSSGEKIEVNSMAGSLNWTKRINYAYAIYAIKASDAASRAEKRATRAAAKKGSDLDFTSSTHRRKDIPPGVMGQNYDKSGYRRTSSSDWAERKAQANAGKLDLDKDIERLNKLFGDVVDNFVKKLNDLKASPVDFDYFKLPDNDYINLIRNISTEIKRITRVKELLAEAGSMEAFLEKNGIKKTPAEWIQYQTYMMSDNIGRFRRDLQNVK